MPMAQGFLHRTEYIDTLGSRRGSFNITRSKRFGLPFGKPFATSHTRLIVLSGHGRESPHPHLARDFSP
jgi:hypothetical protein